MSGVDLHWLAGSPPSSTPTGASFGLPWTQGTIDRTTALFAGSVPLQSWPLAYWPDGSLKWTGHALAADSALTEGTAVHVEPGTPTEPQQPVTVTKSTTAITVTTGDFMGECAIQPLWLRAEPLIATINTSGTTLIESLVLSGSTKAQNGRLVAHVQDGPDEPEITGPKPSVNALYGTIHSAEVEKDGPVRAVIKVRKH